MHFLTICFLILGSIVLESSSAIYPSSSGDRTGLDQLPPLQWTMETEIGRGFIVRWLTGDPQWITMEFQSPRQKGWSGIGFSPKGGMAGADMIIGWFDSFGVPQIKDMYGVNNGEPFEDQVNNYELLGAISTWEGNVFRFKRKWNTCDQDHDFKITNDTIPLIYAYGDLDSSGKPAYHGPHQRGVRSTYLTAATKLAPYPDDAPLHQRNPDILYHDFTMKDLLVPGGEVTRYMCQMMKYPVSEKKQQIIGWRPLIQEQNKQHVHHILVYECYVPEGDSAAMYEADVGKTVPCYTQNMPPHWGQYCWNVPLVWNHGAEGDMLPDHLGIPIGEQHGGATYFVFEMHYDIRDKSSFVDNSGIRAFITDKVRPHDLTSLWIGARFSGMAPLVPPGVPNHKMFAVCTPECTQQSIPSEGISAFSVIFHTHATGRRATLKHIRNGIELPPIYTDNNYDWNYQQARLIDPERRILPGDMLMVQCEYDTTNSSTPRYGGITTDDSEMCIAFLNYYPRMQLASCQWQTSLETVLDAFHIKKVEGDVLDILQLPYRPKPSDRFDPPDEATLLLKHGYGLNPFDAIRVADRESPYFRKSLRDVFDRYFPWSANDWADSRAISKRIEEGKYYAHCTLNGRVRVPLKEWLLTEPKFVKHIEVDEYCNSGSIPVISKWIIGFFVPIILAQFY